VSINTSSLIPGASIWLQNKDVYVKPIASNDQKQVNYLHVNVQFPDQQTVVSFPVLLIKDLHTQPCDTQETVAANVCVFTSVCVLSYISVLAIQ